MVKPLLRELAGPFEPVIRFEYPNGVVAAWERACGHATQNGDAEELHSARDDYQVALLAHLKILDGWLSLLSRFPQEYPRGFAERMARSRSELQKHYDSLFPRWQTIENLEAILLERISVPNEQLKTLAAKYPAPPAWYDESDEPAAKE